MHEPGEEHELIERLTAGDDAPSPGSSAMADSPPSPQREEGAEPHVSDQHSPALTDSRQRPMHAGWLSVERVGGAIVYGIIFILATVGALVLLLVVPKPAWVTLIIVAVWGALVGLIAWGQFGYLPRAYRAMSWTPHPDRLEFRKGVWWRKAITIPRSRVQHTDVTQGPLQRRFGIATLVVHTAGTQYAKVDIPGLEHASAAHLRDWLIAHAEQTDGSDDGV